MRYRLETDRQADRQTDRQIDRQTDRQTDSGVLVIGFRFYLKGTEP